MKKIFAAAVALAAAVLPMIGIGASAREQYLVNGDFEAEITRPWMSTWQNGSGILTRVEEADGNHAVKMQTDSEGRCYLQQNVTGLVPGDRLKLSFKLKIISLEEGGSATVSIGYTNDANVNTGQMNYSYQEVSGDKWVDEEIDILLPENVDKLGILIRLNNGGEVYYDDVVLTDSGNENSLMITNGDLELDRLPSGLNKLTAKLHYVPKEAAESGNLIFALYNKKELSALEIVPFSAEKAVYKEAYLTVPENAQELELKAYVWKNGQTPEPIAEKLLLPYEGKSAVYDRFVTERMRGAYGASTVFYDTSKMQKLTDAGFNTFIFNSSYDGNGTNVNQDLKALDQMCTDMEKYVEETGNMIFVKCSYGARSVLTSNTQFGAFHPGSEHTFSTPCPLSEEYWKQEMLSRFEVIAKHPKIIGIVFDMEMYSGGTTRFTDRCFCDDCVKKFEEYAKSEAAKTLALTDANSRSQQAKNLCIYEEYREWQKGEVTRITAALREKIHAINPDLIIGMMPTYEWLGGMTQGLGTEKMPLMVFSENEYKGSVVTAQLNIADMKNKNLPAVYAVGLWSNSENAIAPADFASKIAQAGPINMGYWVYAIQEMDKDEAFYEATKEGNALLDTELGIK